MSPKRRRYLPPDRRELLLAPLTRKGFSAFLLEEEEKPVLGDVDINLLVTDIPMEEGWERGFK